MSNCAHVWCCSVKSHMKYIHLDIDKTCFQCSSVSESWKSRSLKCVFRWCLFIAETSSSRRGAKTILINLTDHDSCTRLLIPLLSVCFLEVMVWQCWVKHSTVCWFSHCALLRGRTILFQEPPCEYHQSFKAYVWLTKILYLKRSHHEIHYRLYDNCYFYLRTCEPVLFYRQQNKLARILLIAVFHPL